MSSILRELLGMEYETWQALKANAGTVKSVFATTGTVGFANDGVVQTIGVIPANAEIVGITVDVTTAFNDSGTDQLDVGTAASGTAFRSNLDVSSTGQTVTGWTAASLGDVGTSDLTVTAQYDGQNSNSTAGSATVTFFWTPNSGN